MTSQQVQDATIEPRQLRVHNYAAGADALRDGLQDLRHLLKPRRRMTGSEWAEAHGYLSKEGNAQTGKVRLFGYQRGILDAMTDPAVSQVTVLKAARVGYTRMLSLLLGYYIEHDPASIVLAQPTVGDVEDYARTEVLPMLRDTEALRPLVRPTRRGEGQDTLTDLIFSNGATLRLRGAASDDAFRRYSSRVMIADELDADGWRSDRKGSQGDKLALLRTRGETFWNSRLIVGSTPLISQSSMVYREWLASDQRRYHVPCPHCGALQWLKFGGPEVDYGLKWSMNEDGIIEDAWYQCEHCHDRIDETEKWNMDAQGVWIPTAKPKRRGHAGFHLWTGMSLFPLAGWKYIAAEFMEARRKPELLQPFVNLRLGEPFEYREDQKPEVNLEKIEEELEVYDAEVPAQAVFLTMGADVQSGSANSGKSARVEASVWAWGRGEESWLVDHVIIEGGMDLPETHHKLDDLLARTFRKADGTELRIQACAIDMGGHFTEHVRDFARLRVKKRVWAVKGKNLRLGSRSPSVWPRKASRDKADSWYMIDTQLAKDIVGRRFRISQDGPGRIHLPHGVDPEYLKGLNSESRIVDKAGRNYWKKRDPQAYGEPWDCLIYAYAAVCGLKMTFKAWADIDRLADTMGVPKREDVAPLLKARDVEPIPEPEAPKTAPVQKPQPVQAVVKPRPKIRTSSSFMSKR